MGGEVGGVSEGGAALQRVGPFAGASSQGSSVSHSQLIEEINETLRYHAGCGDFLWCTLREELEDIFMEYGY